MLKKYLNNMCFKMLTKVFIEPKSLIKHGKKQTPHKVKGKLNPEINFFLNKILKDVETVFRSFFLVSR